MQTEVGVLKITGLEKFDTPQIWLLYWRKQQQGRTFRQRPQSALASTNCLVSLKGGAFFNADALDSLFLLPNRAISSRWGMGTTAIRAQLGSLKLNFMLIISAPLTHRSNLATLVRVARLFAVKATHRFRDKQGHLHLYISDRNLLGHFWRVEGQKQSLSLFTVTLWTSTTPCSCSSFLISASNMPDNSRQQMSPLDEFKGKVHCF